MYAQYAVMPLPLGPLDHPSSLDVPRSRGWFWLVALLDRVACMKPQCDAGVGIPFPKVQWYTFYDDLAWSFPSLQSLDTLLFYTTSLSGVKFGHYL